MDTHLGSNEQFAELTRKQLQRSVHRSTAELEADIWPAAGSVDTILS